MSEKDLKKLFEQKFSSENPLASETVRELIEILAEMGNLEVRIIGKKAHTRTRYRDKKNA